MAGDDSPTDFFWDLASDYLALDGVEEGTLMGMPCLRVGGEFFATAWPETGDLIVKVSRGRVEELTGGGVGEPFAPAGKVFREWVSVPAREEVLWRDLLEEALEFNRPG